MNSESLFKSAKKHIPGGVNSPVRAFGSVGGIPRFIKQAEGATLTDADGKKYIDYVMSWGAMILGHAPGGVVKAIIDSVVRGTSYGAPTAGEIRLAELIKKAFPSIEKVRLVSSGTEAVMTAVRLARGVTGRKKIIKFDGCYHGHSDSLLVKPGSGVATFGLPGSAGVPKEIAGLTISLPYNDIAAFERVIRTEEKDIACVIVEPIAANMGVIPPREAFLWALRKWTKKYGALLIFDEVISGYRVTRGGAQELYGIEPDLTTLGKIVGGGMPLAALGGPAKIMDYLAPDGPVYQAGTLSGNPLAVQAGISTLETLQDKNIYIGLREKSQHLIERIKMIARKKKRDIQIQSVGSMFTVFFSSKPVENFAQVKKTDSKAYARFFHNLLDKGVYFPPSAFEACFLSTAHSSLEIERTEKIMEKAL
ncbi:MAG: glutamate-1-semialdehyde 2,1-aminomutase [Candidatus Omnitrophica bacterium]|nr:glutamate-1-semialdehyde 2,1-aminomutase [Candidatus Omnitrophota bacterium]